MAGKTESAVGSTTVPAAVEPNPERTRLGGGAALVAAVAFAVSAGVPGLVAAAVVLVGWYLLGGVYAFALGHVGVVSVLGGSAVPELAAVEVGLLGALVASAAGPSRDHRKSVASESASGGVPATGAVGPALLAVAWVLAGGALTQAVGRSLAGLAVAGGLLVAATGLAAYGLHRYQLASLGPAGDSRE